MIPIVIKSFFRGSPADWDMLDTITEGLARTHCFQVHTARKSQNAIVSDIILNIDGIDLDSAFVQNDVPYLIITFTVQHLNWVHCKKKIPQVDTNKYTVPEKHKIPDKDGLYIHRLDGSESSIGLQRHQWVITPDMEHPDFNWKIAVMQSSTQEYLI